MMPDKPFKHRTVLIVDSDPVSNFITQKIIKDAGFSSTVLTHTSVDSALGFLKGIKHIEGSLSFCKPEFIFLDVCLSGIDGWVFLRELEGLNMSFKVVILTNSLNPADKERSGQFKQVIGFFDKPLKRGILKEL